MDKLETVRELLYHAYMLRLCAEKIEEKLELEKDDINAIDPAMITKLLRNAFNVSSAANDVSESYNKK